MSATDAAVQEVGQRPTTERIVNDFAIQVATVNGSGSQTANLVLLRSIFQMGVPVSGKNMFPSNIAGLPTWYTIRASAKGYIGRKKEVDFLVAMNPETAREDVLTLAPGAVAGPDLVGRIRDEVRNLSTTKERVSVIARRWVLGLPGPVPIQGPALLVSAVLRGSPLLVVLFFARHGSRPRRSSQLRSSRRLP